MKTKRILALLLAVAMLIIVMPTTAGARYYEDYHYVSYDRLDISLPVTTEGKTYSLFTEANLENQDGTSFLYVMKSGDRYYTPAHPSSSVTSFTEVDSVAAIDITAYWDSATNTFSNIPNSANLGVMQYQTYAGGASALYLDGDLMFALSVPFEDEEETWFDGGIRYFRRDETYSYNRALWQANGDGSGYLYDSYIDWIKDSDYWVYGVLALKTDGVGNKRFALRNMSEEYNEARAADPDNYDVGVDITAYLYAAPCGHAATEYCAYDAPTCMDKGCKEYWYCRFCTRYFSDAACVTPYECKPVLPALGHHYGETECSNCHSPIPKYTKITSYEQFKTIKPGASFIAVAEIDGENGSTEYYVLKTPLNYTSADIDENGYLDILQIDEDKNGTADILEIDSDSDGVIDAMVFDGFWSETGPDGVLDDDEISQYLFELEMQYTNGYMVDERLLEAIPVMPESDGTINVKDFGALEFIMERKFPDNTLYDQYYGDGLTVKDYENDFYFRIPNFWIRPMITLDNYYYKQDYDFGDCKWWGILFGQDVKAIDEYRAEQFASYPDDSVILYTESFFSANREGELEHGLRFLVNGDEKNFIITSYSAWEEPEGTQIPIYLYSSDAGKEGHEHVWGSWIKQNEEIHKRVCTVEGCSEFDFASHNKDESRGCIPDTENYTLGHWVACTDCGGEYHEYHTREEAGRYYPNYWRDTGDGIHHVVNCIKCGGPVEYAEHRWSNWYSGAKNIDGEWVMGHYKKCENWPCEAEQWRAECIYDEGTVTQEPTCTEKGIKTFVCTADSCYLDTKTHTEEIPELGHDFGEWHATEDPKKEQRICQRDPNHIEERTIHEHTWGDWIDDDHSHIRECQCGEKEVQDHNFDVWSQTNAPTCTEKGEEKRICQDCAHSETREVDARGHSYDDENDKDCNICGFIKNRVDMNGDETLNSADAIYLLRHTIMPSLYPLAQPADVNGDGVVNSADAIYLLRHVIMPELYPLAKK